MKLNFKKEENNKWYVVLPEWEGDKEELEMVMGADLVLDILSKQTNYVSVEVDLDPFKECTFSLDFLEEESDGGVYLFNMQFEELHRPIWICHVTKFVFGDLPKNIYGKVI